MLIESLDKSYTVIRYCHSGENWERYICRDNETHRNYTVVRIKNRDWISHVMEFSLGEMENKKFSDFESCFVTSDGLHLVLAFTDGLTLEEKLGNEACSLTERLEIFQHILEKMLLLEMSDYIQQDCLVPAQIIVDSALEVSFQYELNDIIHYEEYHFDSVCDRLYRLYYIIFERELKRRYVLPLNRFGQTLRDRECSSRLNCYEMYMEIREEIAALSPEEMDTPKTWPFRLWDRMKRLFKPLKRIAVIVLFVVALLYLVFTIRKHNAPDNTQPVFQYIGTLEVKE